MSSSGDDPILIATMEEMGANQVRLRISSGLWPSHLMGAASRWLNEKDQEQERRNAASQSEQIEIARSARDAAFLASAAAERAATAAERQAAAAEKANRRRATIALIMAAISIIVAVISIVKTH